MSPRAYASIALVLALLSVVPANASAADLPVGQNDGVRVKSYRGGVAVVFTAEASRLYRRIAGRRIKISCSQVPAADGAYASFEAFLRAPKRRRTLLTQSFGVDGVDYCRVWRRKTKRSDRRLIVSVPVTQAGAVKIDEEEKAINLVQLLDFANPLGEQTEYPRAAEFFDREYDGRKVRDLPRPSLVALSGPSDPPPAGSVGYWSDGAEHAAVVIVSASGRRLFIEVNADGVLHTNVAEYLYSDFD